MNNVKLTLNTESKVNAITTLKKAADKKAKSIETVDESFTRILSMKNSDADVLRIKRVQKALETGVIAREADAVTKGKNLTKAEVTRLNKALDRLEAEQRLAEMVDEMPDTYWLIQTVERLDEFLALLDDDSEIVFDVETTGVDVLNDKLVGHVLTSVKHDIHAYIPVAHDDESPQLDKDYVTERLRPYYEDENIGKLAHNAKFDIAILSYDLGVTLNGLSWDTQEAMKLLNENESSYRLKELATKYLKMPSLTYGQLFGKKSFAEVPLDVACAYAAKDGDVTLKLANFQRKHLDNQPKIKEYFERVEIPLINTIVAMEATGYLIDTEYAKTYEDELTAEVTAMRAKLIDVLGDINIDSSQQLRPALERVTGETLASTDAKKVLKPLKDKHPIIAELLAYKKLNTLLKNFVKKLPDLVSRRTGKMHGTFNGNGAVTGRMSAGGGGINLQNQPKAVRKLFLAPQGKVLIGGDFSQQEYRGLAYFSRDPFLIEIYATGRDIYAETASAVLKLPIEQCGDGSDARSKAKMILLALAYGMSHRSLAPILKVSDKVAERIQKETLAQMPLVAKWIEGNSRFARKNGYVLMDNGQRKRRLPDAKDPMAERWKRSAAERQATNAIVQGTAAIQTKTTMNAIHSWCNDKKRNGREFDVWCVVHDEVIIQAPDDVTRVEVEEFRQLMLHSYHFGDIPLKTDVEIMRRWGDGIDVDDWFNTSENGGGA